MRFIYLLSHQIRSLLKKIAFIWNLCTKTNLQRTVVKLKRSTKNFREKKVFNPQKFTLNGKSTNTLCLVRIYIYMDV